MKLSDILKYERAFEKLLALFKSLRKTPVGGTATVPEIVTDVGDQRWRFAEHQATREK